MPLLGKIVVIRRNGRDGTHFPLTTNSCLFGRNKECDIRIQLPQVSKEHCKIEVNENNEATLINLSSVNPTNINGRVLEHSTHLKHGDILTILDRSFRFEYPPSLQQSKRLSASQEKLQALNIQQLEQEELYSEQESLQIFDGKTKSENKTESCRKRIRVTTQNDTRTSECKMQRLGRKNEMSPFSKLYELMKNEDSTKTAEENTINDTFNSSRDDDDDGDSQGAASQTPYGRFATNQTTENEPKTWKSDGIPKGTENQSFSSPVLDSVSVEGNGSTKSSASLQGLSIKQEQETEDRNHLSFQDTTKNEVEKHDVIKRSRSADAKPKARESAKHVPEMRCKAEQSKQSVEYQIGGAYREFKVNLTDTAGTGGNDESFQADSKICSRKSRRNSYVRADLVSQVELKSCPETSAENEECLVYSKTPRSDILIENKYLKMEENDEMQSVGPVKTLKELNEIYESEKLGAACSSLCNTNKTLVRNMEQNIDVSNESSFIDQTYVSTKLLAPSTDSSRFQKMLYEENMMSSCFQKENNDIKTSKAKNEQDVDMININGLEDRSQSCILMSTEDEITSEMTASSPVSTKRVSGVKKSPRKRKAREPDLQLQPLVKRKRVSFGGHLSPELFDKRLPANSPLKRGATPARLSLPFGNSPRAVLKKSTGCRRFIIKSISENELHKSILPKVAIKHPTATTPSGRSPDNSTSSCRSMASLTKPCKSPTSSTPPHKSPAASTPPRKSPAASTPTRKSPAASTPPRKSPAASTPTRKSPAASTPTRKSPAASTPTRKSPAASTPTRKSSAASTSTRKSPAASTRKSPAASNPTRKSPAASGPPCKSPGTLARSFHSLPQSEECILVSSTKQDVLASQVPETKYFTEVKAFEHTEYELKADLPLNGSKDVIPKKRSLGRRRSGIMEAIKTKRQSGASKANLIVAKSWAEIVKQGAPKPQQRPTTKCVRRAKKKMPTKSTKSNISLLNTPVKQVGYDFSTGHANSPAPIMIGKAHVNTLNAIAQVPEVKFNFSLKHHGDLDQSFTGLAEIFNTPSDEKQESSLSFVQQTNMASTNFSKINNLEEPGEMLPSPFNMSSQEAHYSQDALSPLLKDMYQIPTFEQSKLKVSPSGTHTEPEEIVKQNSSLLTTGTNEISEVGVDDNEKSPGQKPESVEALSGVKRLLKTPKPETVERLSGIKRLFRTPKYKCEPIESLSGVKILFKTPKHKLQPAEDLLEVKSPLTIPEQNVEPVKALSKVKRLLKTRKQKPEPDASLSGVERLLRTPKQKTEPVEALSGVKILFKTPKHKPEPAEVKSPLTTSVQNIEPVKALSGIKRLLRTRKQKPEPDVSLSGVERLLRTPKQEMEPAEALSGVKRLLKTPKPEAVECLSGVKRLFTTPKHKPEPIESLSGVKILFKTPKHKAEPVEDLLEVKSPLTIQEQNIQPVKALSGVKRLLTTPREKIDSVTDDTSITTLKESPEGELEKFTGTIAKKEQECRMQPVTNIDGNYVIETSNEIMKSDDDMKGMQMLLQTPEQRFEPVEDMVGIEELFKTTQEDFVLVNDYSRLQNLMTEQPDIEQPEPEQLDIELPKPEQPDIEQPEAEQPHADYSTVKEMLDTVGEQKAELTEFVDLKKEDTESSELTKFVHSMEEDTESYMNDGDSKDNMYEMREPKLEACGNKSPILQEVQKKYSKSEDNLEHVTCSMFNELKTAAETIEAILKTENYSLDEIDQNGKKSDFVKESAVNRVARETGVLNPLASVMRTQKRNMEKVTTTGNVCTQMTQRNTRSTRKAKLIDCIQTSINLDQNMGDVNSGQESEDNVSTAEMKRNRIAKRNGKTKASLCLAEKAELKEDGGNSVIKQPSAENEEDDKNKLTFKLSKTNAKNKTEDQGSEAMEAKGTRINLLRRSKRSRSIVNDKFELENNQTKIKENAVKRNKGRKVNILTKINEESMLQGESGTCEEEKCSMFSTKENISKGLSIVVEIPTCTYLSQEDKSEIIEDKYEQDINLTVKENSLIEESSNTSSNFVQEKCVQESQNEESNETQKVHSQSEQTLTKNIPGRRMGIITRSRGKQIVSDGIFEVGVVQNSRMATLVKKSLSENRRGKYTSATETHLPLEETCLISPFPILERKVSAQGKLSSLKNQNEENFNGPKKVSFNKAVKVKQIRRGRSEQSISPNKQIIDSKDQNKEVSVTDKVSKKGRRKIDPESQTQPSLETSSLNSVSGKLSLQETASEDNSNQNLEIPFETVQVLADQSTSECQGITKVSLLRRGRSKNVISKETKCGTEEATDLKDESTTVTVKEIRVRRGRTRNTVSEIKIPPSPENTPLKKMDPAVESFSQGKCTLKEIGMEENPSQSLGETLEVIKTPVQRLPKKRREGKEILPKIDGSKQSVSQEIIECISKGDGQNALFILKKDQSKRGKAHLSHLNNDTSSSANGRRTTLTEALETAAIANTNPIGRGRRMKTDEKSEANSVLPCKKMKLPGTNKNKVLQDSQEKKTFKKGRAKELAHSKTSVQERCQEGDNIEMVALVEDQKMLFKNYFCRRRKPKRNSLDCASSLTVALSSSNDDEISAGTSTEIQGTCTKNDVLGKGRVRNCKKKTRKIVPSSVSLRMQHKLPGDEDFSKNESSDVEKITVERSKRTRRVAKLEEAILKEKCGVRVKSNTKIKDHKVIQGNSISGQTRYSKKAPKEECSTVMSNPVLGTERQTRGSRKARK